MVLNNNNAGVKSKKVAIFSAFYPFRGGIAQFNARLFRSLEKIVNIEAFTFKNQYPKFLFPGTTQFVDEDDKTDPIPAKRIVSTFNPLTYNSSAAKIRQSNPDIFITNYWMSFFSVFMRLMAKSLPKNVKKIAIVHNLIPHEKRFFDSRLNKKFIYNYDGFVVMSQAVQQAVLSIRPDAKCLLIEHPWYDHFGDKISRFEAAKILNIESNKKTLLFFGIIREYKGLDILIDAFSSLDTSYQLIIVGEVYGDAAVYHEKISNSSNPNIHFFNEYIPDDKVHLYFSVADLCILPYRSATQSGITATSFFYEVPIIATNVGGLKETVIPNEMGLIIPPEDTEALKSAILNYFENQLDTKFKQNISKRKQINSWDQYALNVIQFAENC
jgi:glycosyltransferase involved in cell wall biosynthesis